ncbi:MAG: adenylosuccinate lyase [Candidatus Thermoplasmatota archaeon]|nr:adenylosuccinate lyase [Candidatus Thermoplasmatota archaeon]
MALELICPIEYRYGRRESREIFTTEEALRRALRVEAALARALADEKLIPPEAATDIEAAVRERRVTLARVEALEAETRHDIMAIVKALSEVSDRGAAYVHLGATSNDILDTARGLELLSASQLLRSSLKELCQSLAMQAERHRKTAMVGRTHGQHAVPTTFGYKLTNFLSELTRHLERLDEIVPRLAVGKMSGAVGTGASFGASGETIEARVMSLLGLVVEEAPTQVTGRDRLAEFSFWIAMVASTLDRLTTEVRNLQRTEIGELSEPFDESRQVGSSTMAQKRNPVTAENISSLARLVRAFPQTSLENMVSWHERDLANSANERFLYSHGVILLDDMLVKTRQIVEGWKVNAARMQENLAISGGSVMTENVMLELARKGMSRQEAHELMRTLTRGLGAGGADELLQRARADSRLTKWLTDAELTYLFSPQAYVDAAAAKAERVLLSVRARLGK